MLKNQFGQNDQKKFQQNFAFKSLIYVCNEKNDRNTINSKMIEKISVISDT